MAGNSPLKGSQLCHGARQFHSIVKKTQQIGRFYFVCGSHARGKTFRIYLLPKGEKAISNGDSNPCLNKDAVEIYGIAFGQPGWSETYGWIEKGKWVDDVMEIINDLDVKNQEAILKAKNSKLEKEKAEKEKRNTLLEDY